MREKSKHKSVSSKHELSYSALQREPIQLSCAPILPSEQGEAIDEVLRSFGISISSEAFKALVSASMRSIAGSAFSMARAILSSLKDDDSPDITPLKCLLLERMLGLNYLTFEEIASKCGTSKQNAQTQLKRMIKRMGAFVNDPQEDFNLPLFIAALASLSPKN